MVQTLKKAGAVATSLRSGESKVKVKTVSLILNS
jgi:hypothetical protein